MSFTTCNQQNKTLTFLVAVFIITMLTPFFGLLVWSIVSFLLIVFCMISYPKTTFTKPFLYMGLFFLVALIYGMMGKGYGINNGLVLIFLAYISGVAICLNIHFLTDKQVRLLLNILIVVLLYKIIGTFFVLLRDGNAVRNWGYSVQLTNTTSAGLYRLYRYMGMYSYGEGEALAIILPAFVSFFLNEKKRFQRICILVLVIGGLITQYMATLTTSFLMSGAFCALVLVRHFTVRGVKGGFIKGVFLLAAVIIAFFFLLRNNQNAFFQNKMTEVRYSYNEGQAIGDVEKRSDLYKQSLQVCLHSPILGLGVIPSEYGNYTTQTISFHTAILDYWGLFGVFSILLLLAWKGAIQCTYRLLPLNNKKLYKYSFFSLFFLLLLKGPVSIDVSFVFSTVFITIIMMNDYYREKI